MKMESQKAKTVSIELAIDAYVTLSLFNKIILFEIINYFIFAL